MSARKTWLIGENNPYQQANLDEFALYPSPRGCAGWRLCHLIMRIDPDVYCERFERRNLLHQARWSVPAARDAAVALLQESAGATLVLLGARVARAFGVEFGAFSDIAFAPHVLDGPLGKRSVVAVTLPHPSGLSRAWNEPGALGRARAGLRAVGAL